LGDGDTLPPTTTPVPLNPVVVRHGVECRSRDKWLGFKSVEDCAEAVKANGGNFFIYGTGHKSRRCFQEYTESADCPEGWEEDSYDFYSLEAIDTTTSTTTPTTAAATTAAPSVFPTDATSGGPTGSTNFPTGATSDFPTGATSGGSTGATVPTGATSDGPIGSTSVTPATTSGCAPDTTTPCAPGSTTGAGTDD